MLFRSTEFVTSANATTDALSGPIGTIKSALSDVVTELNALVGQPVEVILASVDGTVEVTVQELGQIVAGLITVGSFCALCVGLVNNAF